uniref:(northern house mosquito) hypothetical protein n=1 Tax=Culex pipiens TaxID=7175 RepID=A0A8D8B5Z2_CULPI
MSGGNVPSTPGTAAQHPHPRDGIHQGIRAATLVPSVRLSANHDRTGNRQSEARHHSARNSGLAAGCTPVEAGRAWGPRYTDEHPSGYPNDQLSQVEGAEAGWVWRADEGGN